jgi:hypothetical protein
MHRSILRPSLLALCIAAATALSAASAQAAVTATTLAATGVSATTADLNGAVTTGGKPVVWEFSYNLANNPFGGSYTDSGAIAPGASGPIAVLAEASDLTPSTTYTYQLVATDVTYGIDYYDLAPIYGGSLTFKTLGPGKASLSKTKLKVKHGKVLVVISCSKALSCTGGALTITIRHKRKSYSCGSNSNFSVGAGKKSTIKAGKLSKYCKSLLKKGKVKGTLSATFTYQNTITKSVKLIP